MNKKKICIYTYLPQDVDIAIPLVKALESSGFEVFIYIDEQLIRSSPRSIRKYGQYDIKVLRHPLRWGVVPLRKYLFDPVWQPKCDAFISIVESNLLPHMLGKTQTLKAKSIGRPTATYQHGVDNVGLNYSDDSYPVQDVVFFSDAIWIWGGKENLHKDISQKNLEKIVSVGCIKSAEILDDPIIPCAGRYKRIVGVFENLHWSRYSDNYREYFLECVYSASKDFPDVLFLIKPHHSGRWITGKAKKSIRLDSENILVIDPKDSAWENFTAPAIIKKCDKVLSTPSTVVLDGCVQGKTVAVFGDKDIMGNYEGIPNIRSYSDLKSFLEDDNIQNASEKFLSFYGCDGSDIVGSKMADSLCKMMCGSCS